MEGKYMEFKQQLNNYQEIVNNEKNEQLKGYYMFYLAKYEDFINEVESQKILLAAKQLNNKLLNSLIKIEQNKIFIPSKEKLEKWYKKKINEIFDERLKYNFEIFEECDKYPNLKIRKMKTRWGVYNRIKHND